MPLYPNSSLGQTSQPPLNISVKGPQLPAISDIRELDVIPTQANGQYVRFDQNDDVFYFVETNENNYKTIKRFRFYEDPIPKPEDNFATKQKMQELRGGLADVQLAIQELTNAIEIRAMDATWSNTLVSMSAAELTHADNLYKMFEQYYATIAKPYGPGKVPDYMEDMRDEITQMYMEESSKVKYMHETYKK